MYLICIIMTFLCDVILCIFRVCVRSHSFELADTGGVESTSSSDSESEGTIEEPTLLLVSNLNVKTREGRSPRSR